MNDVKKSFLTTCGAMLLTAITAAAGQDAASFSAVSIKRNTSGLPYSQSADRPDGVALVNCVTSSCSRSACTISK
jgi:hypothetical protein